MKFFHLFIPATLCALSLLSPLTAAPTITSTTITPSSPTNTDAVTVTANVQPSAGSSLSQVQVIYNTGTITNGTVFRETMNTTPATTSWNGTGAQNAWTVTALRAAGDVKQRSGNSNHTTPMLTNGTTDGSTRVTCGSTANVWPGMSISGPNIPVGTTISLINDATTLILSSAATGSGTGLTFTVAGITLTNCSTSNNSPNVSCASTAGMGISGMISSLLHILIVTPVLFLWIRGIDIDKTLKK